ncbi:unnamed protein product [Rotaria sp. Silwood2]|nr:unnamed protein product [Rotaria sp. Silwood2]CAF3922020.1 unnamed protein product [Rotaria sp. Silwood2]
MDKLNLMILNPIKKGSMCNLVQDFCDRFQSKTNNIHEKELVETDVASEFNETNQNEEEDFTKALNYDDHQPKPDHILAVKIDNHRVHVLYTDSTLLKTILQHDQIVFYEVPVSLKKENNDKILMPCVFREDNQNHQNFGLPFYLNIPRQNFRGRYIQVELQKSIGDFLPLSPTDSSDNPPYTASLLFGQTYSSTYNLLQSCLDDHIDFNNLSQFVLNPNEITKAKYDLIAVCNHIGSLSKEHYITHAKSCIDKRWHTFDDSTVSDVNEDDVVTWRLDDRYTPIITDLRLASNKELNKYDDGELNSCLQIVTNVSKP